MELTKFVKWWWKSLDDIDRGTFKVIGGILCFVATLGVIGFFFGPMAVLNMMFTSMGISALAFFIFLVRRQWLKYQKHKEAEAQEIIDRLKNGVVPNSIHDADFILSQLRKRATAAKNRITP